MTYYTRVPAFSYIGRTREGPRFSITFAHLLQLVHTALIMEYSFKPPTLLRFHCSLWLDYRSVFLSKSLIIPGPLSIWERKKILPRFLFVKLKSSLQKFMRSPPWLGWPLWNICVTNDHRYVPFVINTSWSFPHSWLITWFVTRLRWQVPLGTAYLSGAPEFTPGF